MGGTHPVTRYLFAAAVGGLVALAGWVVWVLAHAPVDAEPCDLCADLRVVPPTRSPHHPVYRKEAHRG